MILPKSKLEEIFRDYPIIIENTKSLLAHSQVKIEMGKMSFKNKQFYTTSFDEDNQMLRRLCVEGLPYRYPVVTNEIMQRIEKELSVIQSMKFASYFLINWDIVTYARSKDYFYVGRGSGANSIVAYLLTNHGRRSYRTRFVLRALYQPLSKQSPRL
jgi:DNA polymerase III alpha subunit